MESKEIINFQKDIKSKYIQKDILLFLKENIKLSLIIYNKDLQKMFGVDIKYYKEKSGRYIKGKKNGKGKEYKARTNELMLEGEYLNGKRNGKGKEYYFNYRLKFKGEYSNVKKWNGIGYD